MLGNLFPFFIIFMPLFFSSFLRRTEAAKYNAPTPIPKDAGTVPAFQLTRTTVIQS